MCYSDTEKIERKITRERIVNIKKGKEEASGLAVKRIMNSLYNFNREGNEEKSEHEQKKRHYKYIPFQRTLFISLILSIQKKHKLKNFIDVGSGIGDKVILAELFGDFKRVTGIELNITTYHVSKYFLETGMLNFQENTDYFSDTKKLKVRTERRLINIDAFKYDFSEDDFIYLYVPIANKGVMSNLHLKIVREMPIGGIVIDVGSNNSVFREIQRIKSRIYKDNKHYYGRRYFKKVGEKSFRVFGTRW